MLSRNPHMTSLELSQIPLSARDISRVVELCPNLTKLGLRRNRQLTDAALVDAVTRLPQLRHLDVKLCAYISDTSIERIVRQLGAQLEELDVSYCRSVSDRTLHALAECCPNLLRLHIEANPRISGEAVAAVMLHCPRLIVLNVRNCDNLDDSLFDFEAPPQPFTIEHFDLTGCYNVSPHLVAERAALLMPAVRQFIVS